MRIPQIIPYPRDPNVTTRLMTGNLHALLDWVGVGLSLIFPLFRNEYNKHLFPED